MQHRRQTLKVLAGIGAATLLPFSSLANTNTKKTKKPFRFCLNTSTISGQQSGIVRYMEIAAEAGYDGIEIWMRDLKAYLEAGGAMGELARLVKQTGLVVENAIGFAPWMVADETERKAGMKLLAEEMELLAQLGCKRIAAPPAGVRKDQPVDLLKAGQYYREALALGRKTGVMPQLEFWGASGTVFHLGQALAIAAAANDPDARLLPDVYHLFRGDSGFEGLKLLKGSAIEIFHLNDYPADKPRTEQNDGDRVYPGDGAAPLAEIINTLSAMGGTKVLSLELFNRTYWQQDPLEVAKTGLAKMKKIA